MATMTGKEAVIEILCHKKVKYVFGLPGATEVLFMDALEKQPGIKYILGLNEAVVAGIAEGYARTSGEVGVLNLHTHSGLAASLPMLDNAYKGRVPLVVTAGQQHTRLLMQDPPLSGDLVKTASQVTKWSAEVLNASDIPIAMHRAFKMALQPPKGPVFISLPYDVLDQSLDFEYMPDEPPYTRLRPDQDAIAKAATALAKAKTPTILVESGVARNEALSEVVRLAELIGARVYQPWMTDVNFPVSHPQYMGDLNTDTLKAKGMLRSVDVLVVVGCRLFGQAIYLPAPLLSKTTKVIQIDDDPWEIAKNFPVTVGIQGNIKSSLNELTEVLQKRMSARENKAAQSRIKKLPRRKKK